MSELVKPVITHEKNVTDEKIDSEADKTLEDSMCRALRLNDSYEMRNNFRTDRRRAIQQPMDSEHTTEQCANENIGKYHNMMNSNRFDVAKIKPEFSFSNSGSLLKSNSSGKSQSPLLSKKSDQVPCQPFIPLQIRPFEEDTQNVEKF